MEDADASRERGGDPRRLGLPRDRGRRRRGQRPRRRAGGVGGCGRRRRHGAARSRCRRCATRSRAPARASAARNRRAGTRRQLGGIGSAGGPLARHRRGARHRQARRRVARRRRSTRSRPRPPSSPQPCRRNVAQGLGSLFAGLISGATTLKDAIGTVIARLGELALTRGFETLLAGIGFGSGPLGQLASFLLPDAAGCRRSGDGRPALPRRRARARAHRAARARHGDPEPRGSAAGTAAVRRRSTSRSPAPAAMPRSARWSRPASRKGLRAYDARLADRVARIGADPRFRG